MTSEDFDRRNNYQGTKIYKGSELDNWRWGDERYWNREEYWKIKNFRLFSGYLNGYLEGGYQKNEVAVADRYRIFFKNGTFDLDKPACSWVNQLPQGFSCVRATKSIQECDGFSAESFVRVPCNEIVLKVAQHRDCRGMVRYSDCYNMDTFDDKDCFADDIHYDVFNYD